MSNYTPKTWVDGDAITTQAMNNIEMGIEGVYDEVNHAIATKIIDLSYLPTSKGFITNQNKWNVSNNTLHVHIPVVHTGNLILQPQSEGGKDTSYAFLTSYSSIITTGDSPTFCSTVSARQTLVAGSIEISIPIPSDCTDIVVNINGTNEENDFTPITMKIQYEPIIPLPSTTAGTYVLTCTVDNNGVPTYSWVAQSNS